MLSLLRSSTAPLAGGALFRQSCRFKVYKKPVRSKRKMPRFPRINVILTEDVEKLGVKGEEVQVRRGHARNDLIQHKKGVYATEESRRKLKTVFAMDDVNVSPAERLQRAVVNHMGSISETVIAVPSDVADKKIPRQPITASTIHNRLMNIGLSFLFEEQIVLEEDINEFGKFECHVDLGRGPMPLAEAVVPMKLHIRRWKAKEEYIADKRPEEGPPADLF